jgi:putative Holliday junction resolvase
MRVLALDYGSARCGCAVSDPTGVLATPLEPVLAPSSRRGLRRIAELVEDLGVERVVVGLPLRLAGGDSAQTRASREFAETLRRRLPVPVELYDERFTTRIAQLDGLDPAAPAAARPLASEDSRAAAHLLSSWLESRLAGGRDRA